MAGELKARWRKVTESDVLKRSSHAVAAIDDQIYLFGGELVARQPKDSEVYALAVINGMFYPRLISFESIRWAALLTFEQNRSQYHEPFIHPLPVQHRELAPHSPL